MLSKRGWAATAILVVAFAGAMMYRSNNAPVIEGQRPAPTDPVHAGAPKSQKAPEPLAGAAAPGSTKPTERKAGAAEMRAQFESAPNYAAFIQNALHRPEEGGRFYASLAYSRCQNVLSVSIPDANSAANLSPAAVKARAALEQFKTRCQGVTDQYQDPLAFSRAARDSRGGPDALLPEGGRGLFVPVRRETSAADLARAQGSGDPYLLATVIEANVEFLVDALGPDFEGGKNHNILFAAASAAACEISGTCTDSLLVYMPCALGGRCGEDYRELLRASVDPSQQELFDRARKALLKLAGR